MSSRNPLTISLRTRQRMVSTTAALAVLTGGVTALQVASAGNALAHGTRCSHAAYSNYHHVNWLVTSRTKYLGQMNNGVHAYIEQRSLRGKAREWTSTWFGAGKRTFCGAPNGPRKPIVVRPTGTDLELPDPALQNGLAPLHNKNVVTPGVTAQQVGSKWWGPSQDSYQTGSAWKLQQVGRKWAVTPTDLPVFV